MLLQSALSLLLMAGLVSCDKDHKTPEPQPSGAILPAVIKYTYGATATPDGVKSKVLKFEYDIHDRIRKIHSEQFLDGVSNGVVTTVSLEYKESWLTAILTRTDWDIVNKYDFPINGSEVESNGLFPIKLDEGSRALNYQRWDNRRYYELTYDTVGNASSIRGRIILTGEVKEHYTFTHGTSNGVFRNVKTPAWFITSEMGVGSYRMGETINLNEFAFMQLTNNCTRSADEDSEAIYEYNYTLNEDNFPTQIVRNPNFDGGEYARWDIEYTKAE